MRASGATVAPNHDLIFGRDITKLKTKYVLSADASLFILSDVAYAQEQAVTIGYVGPTTGNATHSGKDNENSARMAIDDLNKKGITIGGKQINSS